MGNQLVSSVKTVIRPIDYYLSEVPDFKFKASLGQTQFLKVALCIHGEGDIVVKVLPHEDPSLLLEQYKQTLLALAKITATNVSIASFRIVEVKSNFAYIARQYVRYSLYDRLSTRPFLTNIEKCWIVYQIFKCIGWCHERQIYHGDIKLENILVTSSLWVVVTDFASFKPVSLPEDNPSYFNYFFDTSRRRCCNIAPERFVPSNLSQVDNNATVSTNISFNSLSQDAKLTDKMDMFSIGCILAEMFSDNVLFDLSGLLYYKDRKTDRLENSIKQIQNTVIQELVQNLTNLDPSKRKSCSQVLTELSGVLFPKFFDKLFVLMRTLVRLPPDAKILYLSQEIEIYLPMILNDNCKGILILLMLVTSSLRSLKHVHCKIEAQRLVCRLVKSSPSVSFYIADRLIPYFANFLTDTDHRVRGEAINSITELLEQVKRLPPSDNNIFTDYLMDILVRRIQMENSTYVRVCAAKNIGRLSKIALNFLNQSCDQNYDDELNELHNYFQNLVSHLLTDSNNCVRRTLLLTPENCAQLCTFFGRQKTNEVILSHIITFLNDKNDFQLRISFFDNIIIIASYLGVQCSPILYPLLQQGLCDAEEIVISKTIFSIASLVEQGLLHKNTIYDLISEILPLLFHPNHWIINSVVFLVTILSEHLSLIDFNCKIVPLLAPFMSREMYCYTNKFIFLESLKSPIPRAIFDTVLATKEFRVLEALFELMNYRKTVRHSTQLIGALPNAIDHNNLTYKRLLSENINDAIEEQLLILYDLISKIHRNQRNYSVTMKYVEMSTVINYKSLDIVRSMKLADSIISGSHSISSGNQEWQHMFGPNSKNNTMFDEISSSITTAQEAKEIDLSYFECPPCSRDVKQMLVHKKNSFVPISPSTTSLSTSFKPKGFLISHLHEHKACVNQMAPYGKHSFLTCSDDGTLRYWDISGIETRNMINRSKFLFKMEFSNGTPINFKGVVCCGDNIITYTNEGIYIFEATDSCISFVCSFKVGSSVPLLITSLTALSNNLFAVSLTDSVIYGYDTRYLNAKNFFVPVFKLRLSPNQRTITSIDGTELILFAATAYGYIAGFDLRFNLKINSFNYNQSTRISKIKYTLDGLYSSVYGSSEVVLWDYKLSQKNKLLMTGHKTSPAHPESSSVVCGILPIKTSTSSSVITAGSDMRIRYWDLNEPERSYIISDPSFKACNFCLGKPCTSTKLPPISSSSISYSGSRVTSGGGVIMGSGPGSGVSNVGGGHHQFLNQQYSGQLSPAPPLAMYNSKQVDDMHVIQEVETGESYQKFLSSHHCSLDQQFVSTAHHDCITDLLRIKNYLISSGRNGTVKIWR